MDDHRRMFGSLEHYLSQDSSISSSAILENPSEFVVERLDDMVAESDGLRNSYDRNVGLDTYECLLRNRESAASATSGGVEVDAMYSILVTPRSRMREIEELKVVNQKYTADIPQGTRTHQHMRIVPPHQSIPEKHRYTFALVLKTCKQVRMELVSRKLELNESFLDRLEEYTHEMHKKCVRRLANAGLGVVVLENDDRNGGHLENICILVDPYKTSNLLKYEFKREKDEIAIRSGDSMARLGSKNSTDRGKVKFSPALELQLTHNIIENAFKDYDVHDWKPFDGTLKVNDVVEELFPLHDKKFNAEFFHEYRNKTFDFSVAKATTGNSERWAVEELRLHFGERVAFLFAFLHVYNKMLFPLTLVCVLFYTIFRVMPFESWKIYMRLLSILGFAVVALWAPSVLVLWKRENSVLVEKWNLRNSKETIFEKNDENPDFKYIWEKNKLTGEMEKIPKSKLRNFFRYSMAIFVLLSAILQCILLVPFIQWYVFAKLAPVCSDTERCNERTSTCVYFLTCFNSQSSTVGTDRWLHVLIQGILLGLTIDVIMWEIFNALSSKLVEMENYSLRSEFENRIVHRRFLFVWSNWFFWFLFLAFVYLPFGKQLNEAFVFIGFWWFKDYEWTPSILTLDTLFVTPLVVTQLLNLILETAVPYLIRKCKGTSIRFGGRWRGRKATVNLDTMEPPTLGIDTNAEYLAAIVSSELNTSIPLLDRGNDTNSYTAIQILADSKLTVFDPMNDYLDAVIQFSYVVMFTAVWPLLPLPAFINNILEVRGDAFRLLFAQRRPMPRRDNGIGEWLTVLKYASAIGVLVVAGFIHMYHFGFWQYDCDSTFSDAVFVPFKSMNETDMHCPAVQFDYLDDLFWLLVLEHLGLFVRHLVLTSSSNPSSISSVAYKRLKEIDTFCSIRCADESQFRNLVKLRSVFDKHDASKNGYLDQHQLVCFLSEWLDQPLEFIQDRSLMILRYMDKLNMGKVPFATVGLILQNVEHDRFLSKILMLDEPPLSVTSHSATSRTSITENS